MFCLLNIQLFHYLISISEGIEYEAEAKIPKELLVTMCEHFLWADTQDTICNLSRFFSIFCQIDLLRRDSISQQGF